MAKQVKKPADEKRPYHRGNVAEDLVAAAVRLLKTERYEDLSVRRLTREIGVTPANFYNHFPNLEDLLLTIAASAHLRRAALVEKIIARCATRIEAAQQSALDFVEFATANPEIFRIMFGLPSRNQHPGFVAAADKSFGELVYLVYGERLYDPTNLEETHIRCQTAYGFFALVYGLARIVLEQNIELNSKAEVREFVEKVVASFIDGTVGKDFNRPMKEPLAKRAG
jgi:AcrR family transcriptional regulator